MTRLEKTELPGISKAFALGWYGIFYLQSFPGNVLEKLLLNLLCP
jgi:hypothetical protein